MNLPRLLDSNMNEVRRLNPISLSITENIVPLSTARMTLPRDQAIPDGSYVELFTENGSVGIYKATVPSIDYTTTVDTYSLEHAVTDVGGYLVRTKIDNELKTLPEAITKIFSYYPTAANGGKWQIGTVCSGYVVLSADYSNILQTMNSVIKQIEGAYMTFDFTTSPWTINIITLSDTVSAEGRLNRNIKSVTVSRDYSKLCTRVWVTGLDYNRQRSYMDADTKDIYGVYEAKVDGSYTRTQAQKKATAYLDKYKHPLYSVSISGEDFSSITGETLDRVAIGKTYRLAIPDFNFTLSEPIISISWEDVINTPYDVKITLGNPEVTIVNTLSEDSSEYNGAGGSVERIWDVSDMVNSLIAGSLQADTINTLGLAVYDSIIFGRNGTYYNLGVDQLTINGNTYYVVTGLPTNQ